MVSMISLIAVGQTVREYVQGSVWKIGSLVSRLSIRTDRDRPATYHFSINLVPFPSYGILRFRSSHANFSYCRLTPCWEGYPWNFTILCKKIERRPNHRATRWKSLIMCTTVISTKHQHALDRQTGGNQYRAQGWI